MIKESSVYYGQGKRSSYSHPRSISPTRSFMAVGPRRLSEPRTDSTSRDRRIADMMRAYQKHDRGRIEEETSSVISDVSSIYSGSSLVSSVFYDAVRIPKGESVENCDTISLASDCQSVASLNDQLSTWTPLPNDEVIQRLSVKRKYSTFGEAISDDEDIVNVAKRPRTPDNRSISVSPPISSRIFAYLGKLLKIFFKIFLVIFIIVMCIFSYVYYKNHECLVKQSLQLDFDMLNQKLSDNLFGQKLARKEIIKSLKDFEEESSRLLVIYLLGWTGSGKTYTASMLSSLMPIQANTHLISCALSSAVDEIIDKVSRACGKSLLVLDDIEAADEENLQNIENLILDLNDVHNNKSLGTIVVITSSAGGNVVNQLLFEGADRDKLSTHTILESMSQAGIFIPLYQGLTRNGIPIKLVPYLPLGREEVRQCVIRMTNIQGELLTEEQVDSIVSQTHFTGNLASTGCKQISSRMNIMFGDRKEL